MNNLAAKGMKKTAESLTNTDRQSSYPVMKNRNLYLSNNSLKENQDLKTITFNVWRCQSPVWISNTERIL